MSIFLVVLNIILLTLFPIFLLARLVRKREANLFSFGVSWLFAALWITYFYQGGFWPAGSGYYTRYLVVICFVVGTIYLSLKFKTLKKSPFNKWQVVSSFFSITFIALLSLGIYTIHQGKQKPAKGVELAFPLKGRRYFIAHGGCNEILNHHVPVPAQKFALDICQLTPLGLRANTLIPGEDLSSYAIYGEKLYSPCSGTVVDAINHLVDQIPPNRDPKNPCGNFLAIKKHDADIVIIIAHLKQGSVQKEIGESVEQGEYIGDVGNSGNTSEPHLHIHAVESTSSDYIFEGKGIPMFFDGNFYVRNDLVRN